MNITTLSPGDIYIPKEQKSSNVFIQIGTGTDCGIFIGNPEDSKDTSLAFRVVVNQKDLKRNWKKIGNSSFLPTMENWAKYGESDIGTDNFFETSLEDLEVRIPISFEDFSKLEPLAVWETIHIWERLSRNKLLDGHLQVEN